MAVALEQLTMKRGNGVFKEKSIVLFCPLPIINNVLHTVRTKERKYLFIKHFICERLKHTKDAISTFNTKRCVH